MIRHFGVLIFKKEISESMIEESLRTMKKLVLQIPGLPDMEYGPYSSPEGMNDVHDQAKEAVVPCLERAIVFDFVVK